ncbi:hypothetical protein JHK85_019379 [Glycine max]|nr:hypothetical protein JHK85_019379 [Glycine max]
MMGCLDETRTLEYGQVFVQFSNNRLWSLSDDSFPYNSPKNYIATGVLFSLEFGNGTWKKETRQINQRTPKDCTKGTKMIDHIGLVGDEFVDDEDKESMVVALGGGGGSCCIVTNSGIKVGVALSKIHPSSLRNLSKSSFMVL